MHTKIQVNINPNEHDRLENKNYSHKNKLKQHHENVLHHMELGGNIHNWHNRIQLMGESLKLYDKLFDHTNICDYVA